MISILLVGQLPISQRLHPFWQSTVEFQDPAVGTVVVLLHRVYEAIADAVQENDLAFLAKKAVTDWATDNPC
jgi:hypothetical protein